MNAQIQAVFVDRDGTLGGNDVSEPPRDFFFYPCAQRAVRRLRERRIPVFALTNQSLVARGEAVLEDIQSQLLEFGLDDAFICPHQESDGCGCRKPKPGLLLQAAGEKGLDLTRCAVIGDSAKDMLAADCVGAVKVLVSTGAGPSARQELAGQWPHLRLDYVADDLADAVDWLLEEKHR